MKLRLRNTHFVDENMQSYPYDILFIFQGEENIGDENFCQHLHQIHENKSSRSIFVELALIGINCFNFHSYIQYR